MANDPQMNGQPAPVYPDVTIYAVRDSSGKLEPIVCSLGGISLPVLDGAIEFSPNATKHGTRAMTATLTFPIGAGGVCEVSGPEDVPDLATFVEA